MAKRNDPFRELIRKEEKALCTAFIGLVALSLFCGTVLAQAPAQPQGGVWDGGQFKAQNCPGSEQPPKPEENASSGTGMWIMIAIGVGVVVWLVSKPKQRILPLPFPVPGPKQGGGCAVLIVAGATLLALAGIALACL